MKNLSYKRIFSYIIDLLIVSVVSTLLTSFIPLNDRYSKVEEELLIIVEQYVQKEIDDKTYLDQVNDLSYIITKETVVVQIVSTMITLVYFVVFQYYFNGQTLGKKLMKIKVVSNDENKKINMNNFLIRSLIIDSILLNLVSIITILLLNQNAYFKTYDIATYIFLIIYIVSYIMISFRKDERGLHDILAGTKVISTKTE